MAVINPLQPPAHANPTQLMSLREMSYLTQLTPSRVLISPAWVPNSLAVLPLYPPGSSCSCTHTPNSALSLREISYLTQLTPSKVLISPAWVHNSLAVLLLYPTGSSYFCLPPALQGSYSLSAPPWWGWCLCSACLTPWQSSFCALQGLPLLYCPWLYLILSSHLQQPSLWV